MTITDFTVQVIHSAEFTPGQVGEEIEELLRDNGYAATVSIQGSEHTDDDVLIQRDASSGVIDYVTVEGVRYYKPPF